MTASRQLGKAPAGKLLEKPPAWFLSFLQAHQQKPMAKLRV